MKRASAIALTGVLVAVCSVPAAAYLKLGSRVGTRTVTLEWPQMPIRYYVTNRDAEGVTAQQLQAGIARAFSTWDAVPTARLSSEFAGFTAAAPTLGDGQTVLGFQSRPELDRVLGATSFMIDTVDGSDRRGRHLLQLGVPLVGCVQRRKRTLRSRVDRAARDRAPARSGALRTR